MQCLTIAPDGAEEELRSACRRRRINPTQALYVSDAAAADRRA